MRKFYTENELRAMGMGESQIKAILNAYKRATTEEYESEENVEEEDLDNQSIVPFSMKHEHNVEIHNKLEPTSLSQLESYKDGVVVELPPFAEGQPFIARLVRPSMLKLVKTGQIPNSLLNQATSLFANGTGALDKGRNGANVNELFDVIDVIVDAALKEPTLEQIRSVGMELSDDQLMAIFSYTQRGVKALESFRIK